MRNNSIYDDMCKQNSEIIVGERMMTFLLASYFGEITEDNIYDACIARAYLDLSRNIPYKYSVSTIERMKKSKDETDMNEANLFETQKVDFKKQMRDCIISELNSDSEPLDVITHIFESANKYGQEKKMWKDNESFYFGLAQKWVNMTLKYLWLFGRLPKHISEEKLHAPIDSYIIHAAMSSNKEYGLNLKVNGLRFDTSWSRLGDSLYKDVQQEISEQVKKSNYKTVMEWEQFAWIKQAKYEA